MDNVLEALRAGLKILAHAHGGAWIPRADLALLVKAFEEACGEVVVAGEEISTLGVIAQTQRTLNKLACLPEAPELMFISAPYKPAGEVEQYKIFMAKKDTGFQLVSQGVMYDAELAEQVVSSLQAKAQGNRVLAVVVGGVVEWAWADDDSICVQVVDRDMEAVGGERKDIDSLTCDMSKVY